MLLQSTLLILLWCVHQQFNEVLPRLVLLTGMSGEAAVRLGTTPTCGTCSLLAWDLGFSWVGLGGSCAEGSM